MWAVKHCDDHAKRKKLIQKAFIPMQAVGIKSHKLTGKVTVSAAFRRTPKATFILCNHTTPLPVATTPPINNGGRAESHCRSGVEEQESGAGDHQYVGQGTDTTHYRQCKIQIQDCPLIMCYPHLCCTPLSHLHSKTFDLATVRSP